MSSPDDQSGDPEIEIKSRQPSPPPPPPGKGQAPMYPTQPHYPVQYNPQPQYSQVYLAAPIPPKSGKATAAMVLGICALSSLVLGCCFSLLFLVTFVLGILAVVFGVQGKNEIKLNPGLAGYGQAQAGFVMGIVSVGLATVLFLVAFVFIGATLIAGA